MTAIKSIKVLRNTKYNTVTVYVNLDNGHYEVYTKEGEKRNFTGKPELLDEAKKLAMVNGKWQNWSSPRTAAYSNQFASDDEGDAIDDINALREFEAKHPGTPRNYTEEELANKGL